MAKGMSACTADEVHLRLEIDVFDDILSRFGQDRRKHDDSCKPEGKTRLSAAPLVNFPAVDSGQHVFRELGR